MDIPRMLAMNRFWRRNPPLRLMVQSYLGIKPKDEAASAASFSSENNSSQDLADFMQLFSAVGGSVG